MEEQQFKLNQKATDAAWKEIDNNHTKEIQSYLIQIQNNPEQFLLESINATKLSTNKHELVDNDIEELSYIWKTIKIYKGVYEEFQKDINLRTKKQDKNKNKKQDKKQKPLSSKEQIIKKNLEKRFKQGKYTHPISNALIKVSTNPNLCEIIYICKQLEQCNLVHTFNKLLKLVNIDNDIDYILNNLDAWKKKKSVTNFKLTKCQQSLIKFVLDYCNNQHKSNTMLEMSNTGAGKTVGLILSMGILWRKIIYNSCVSHTFTIQDGKRLRTHSVRFPTKVIIAVLPSAVISFVQTALTSMKVPWAFVSPTSVVVIDENNPSCVINYSPMYKKVFQHFKEGGSCAPAIFLTTEKPNTSNSIFNCLKAVKDKVFDNIIKYVSNHPIKLDSDISYIHSEQKIEQSKVGNSYTKYDPNSIIALIGDDLESISVFNQFKPLFNPNILNLITTATPGGLSKTNSENEFTNSLPSNTNIPFPQDDVRNCGGVSLIGTNGYINILRLSYNNLFKSDSDQNNPHNWSIVFDYYRNGLFERKYIIPHLYRLCSQLSTKLKHQILNRYMFFDNNIEMDIDCITRHILLSFSNILKSDDKDELLSILLDNNSNDDNSLFTDNEIITKLIGLQHRGIILCSPKFTGDCTLDTSYISLLVGNESDISNELSKYVTYMQKYDSDLSKLRTTQGKSSGNNGMNKNEMMMTNSMICDKIIKPSFPLKYQIFSVQNLKKKKYDFVLDNTNKIPINPSQINEAIRTNDTRLAQGIISIDPDCKRLDSVLKSYTSGNPDNARCVQFKTDAFNTIGLVLGANPPSKLNTIVANYEIVDVDDKWVNIFDGINTIKYPKISVTNLLLQIAGRIGRGILAETHNYIFTTDSVANILISTTPKILLYNELSNLSNKLIKLQSIIRRYLNNKFM